MTKPNFHSIYNPAVNYNTAFTVYTSLNAALINLQEQREGRVPVNSDQTVVTVVELPVNTSDETKTYLAQLVAKFGFSNLLIDTVENMLDTNDEGQSTKVQARVKGRALDVHTVELDDLFDVPADKEKDYGPGMVPNPTFVALCRNIHIGDIVASTNSQYPLRSGGQVYGAAMVASLDPLILISQEGDMRWSSDPKPEYWEVRRRATAEQFAPVLQRLQDDKNHELLAQIEPFAPKRPVFNDAMLMYVEEGVRIIEEAERKARRLDGNNGLFGMTYKEGVIYQRGLQAAYQHALEMMAPPSSFNDVGRYTNPFGLSQNALRLMLHKTLKPAEISGDPEMIHRRATELVKWFAQLAQGDANPKWLESHAFELAYYVATNSGNRYINIEELTQVSFLKGVHLDDDQRQMMIKYKISPSTNDN